MDEGVHDQEYEQMYSMRDQLVDEALQFSAHFRKFAEIDEQEAEGILMMLIKKCWEVKQMKVEETKQTNPEDLPF